jgi:hypothetical protein
MTILHSNIWRVCLLLLAGAAAGVATKHYEPASAQSGAELTGDRVSLTDQAGVTRISFGFAGGSQQFTYVWLSDSNGTERVRLTISPDKDAPELTFYNQLGKPLRKSHAALGGSGMKKSDFSDLKKGPLLPPTVATTSSIGVLQSQIKDLQNQVNKIVAALKESSQ